MTATADSSPITRSPRASPLTGDGGGQGPHSRRNILPSPWAQVVRGDLESVPAVPHSPSPSSSPRPAPTEHAPTSDSFTPKSSALPPPAVDCLETAALPVSSDSSNGNAARPMKPAWNQPSKGIVVSDHVMDAVSWPALSESTRASPKSPSDCSKSISDASLPASQGPSTPLSPQKQVTNCADSSSTPNHNGPVRQRSTKHGGSFGHGSSFRGSAQPSLPPPPPPPPPPPFPVFRMPPNKYGNFMPVVPVVPDLSTRELHNDPENRAVGAFVLQSSGAVANGYPVQRNRRTNFVPQHRGVVSYRKSNGGGRDQNCEDYEHNSPHSSTFRGAGTKPQAFPPRGFIGPPNTAAFITPQPIRPFGTDMASPVYVVPALVSEPLRGFPFITHPPPPPPPLLFTAPEPSLSTLLLNQIEYYFSDANLMTDDFLKANMDEKGWVPITLIASFRRVRNLTDNVQLILDFLRSSTVVEVEGGKVRKRNEWMKWIPSSGRSSGGCLHKKEGVLT